ncbi:hypothetical protein C8J56DRAFT_335233 [Mycena floridula]|nr:hypothetical protein C8J56DRAFT_335233 [Mycena floridula]
MSFVEPPTHSTLLNAQVFLGQSLQSLDTVTAQISQAETALQKIVSDAQLAINALIQEQTELTNQVSRTRSYLAPVRRLPIELLREVFYGCFDDHPCIAWVLAAVCKSWRRLALDMPRIWSKIRMLTLQQSSPDTIRLWIERSGPSVPLDIEIFLKVSKTSGDSSPSHRGRRRAASPSPVYPSWAPAYNQTLANGVPSLNIVSQFGIPPATTPMIIPINPVNHDAWGPVTTGPTYAGERFSPRADRYGTTSGNRSSTSWGYVALYYILEQMHRWERFVFRFQKQFPSIGALQSIYGDAPLLREFEVSCGESAPYPDWSWLPSMHATAGSQLPLLPKLDSLTLQFVPFKWTSPMFRNGLRTLHIRTLPTVHIPLDRILHILKCNQETLQYVSIHFSNVNPVILPLSPLSLPELKEFSLGGHHTLSQLLESLVLPSLEELNLDIDARDSLEEVILQLVARSNASSTLKHLSVAYGFGCGRSASKRNKFVPNANKGNQLHSPFSPMYYGPGIVLGWSTVLPELHRLESLRVGGTPMESILMTLAPPDDDGGPNMTPGFTQNWICPNLRELGIKNCHAHSEAAAKLVQLIEARNPVGTTPPVVINGVSPKKLQQLELYECSNLGQDVVQWLQGKLDEVIITEPPYDRTPLLHHSFM